MSNPGGESPDRLGVCWAKSGIGPTSPAERCGVRRRKDLMSDLCASPLSIIAIREGVIVCAGAGAIALTPAAAKETAERIIDAARLACSGTIPPDELDE